MTQPTDPWMQQVAATLGNGAPLPTAGAPVMLGQPAPAPAGGPSLGWLSGAAPLLNEPAPAGPLASMPPPAMSSAATPPPAPAAPPPAPAASAPIGPPPPPPPKRDVPDVQFAPVGGGVRPAGEADIRGPRQNAHLMASFEDPLAAADRMDLRSQLQAQREADQYEINAQQALEQQEAAQKVQLQRQGQLERAQMDFEDQVQKLGQMKLDSNRWWASKSTPDKIGTAILAFVGGLSVFDPRGNGENLAYKAIMREADQDLEAQKFDYMTQMDQAKGAQNAFALAMDRYKNEDAAAAATRAASIDFALAKLGQVQAQWKGTEAANAADELRAKLLSERERTIAAGIRFVPAASAPNKYKMIIRGQEVPGLVDEKTAQQYAVEHGVKPAERVDEEMVKGGINFATEMGKAGAKRAEKADEGARDIAHQMQSAGIPKMRALTQAALEAMAEDEGGKGEAATRALIKGLVPFVGESAANAIMSDKANAREQAFQAFANLNMNQLSGGAISPSEEARLKAQLGSTADPAARRRALTTVMKGLDAAQQNIEAGNSEEAAAAYRARNGSATTQTAKSLTFHGK